MTTLILSGLFDSGPQHWQSHWQSHRERSDNGASGLGDWPAGRALLDALRAGAPDRASIA